MNSSRRAKHKSILIKFLCHLTTCVLAIYMLLKSSNSNEAIAWYLVMFFMCRIIVLECLKPLVILKREQLFFDRLKKYEKELKGE